MIVHTRFKINSPKVIHETIDGETVIVNLDSGNYYSLDRVGAEIWNLIREKVSIDGVIESIASRYDAKKEEIAKAVYHLINELQQELLIVVDGSEMSANDQEHQLQDITESSGKLTSFEPPMLSKYTDMQDLLLLDPIHDVDEAGWPHMKPTTSPE